jgi:hypothetical protein
VVRSGWQQPDEDTPIDKERATSDTVGFAAIEWEDTLRTALALVKDEFTKPAIAQGSDGIPLSAVVAREPLLASIEVWNFRDSIAGRERTWLDLTERLPDGLGVSDVLLLEKPDSLPASLHMAIPLTRSNAEVAPGERLGLFWEVYGVGEYPQTLEFTLTVKRLGTSFLRRAAEWAGIVGRREDVVRVRWSEAVSGFMGITPRSIGVQLEESMSGEYVVTLSVRSSSGEEATVERHLVVR